VSLCLLVVLNHSTYCHDRKPRLCTLYALHSPHPHAHTHTHPQWMYWCVVVAYRMVVLLCGGCKTVSRTPTPLQEAEAAALAAKSKSLMSNIMEIADQVRNAMSLCSQEAAGQQAAQCHVLPNCPRPLHVPST
jgi:hypothetical protein